MKKMSKGKFAKLILVGDLLFLLCMCVWAMVLASKGLDASSTLTPILTVGGTELLLLMLKRVFGERKDANE